MIEINKLKKIYGDRCVLDIEKLTVNKGDFVVLKGHNGSGKSTLLKILAGTEKKTEGEIKLDGQLFYLPQQSLPFNRSVRSNILFCLDGDKKSKNELCDKVLEALDLKHLENKNAKTLSGGEAQRLALARLLCRRADIILLDEPSSAADSEGRRLINEIICRYRKETGCTVIMSTHTGELPEGDSIRIIELCDGKIVKEEKTDDAEGCFNKGS